MVLSLTAAVIALVGCVLLGAAGYGVCAVVAGACGYSVYRTKKPVRVVHFTGAVMLILMLGITQPMKGVFEWQYPIQKLYAEKKGGFDLSGFFPDRLPACDGGYSSDFMPSIMQGSGWFSVSYNATESINDFIVYCKDNSRADFTLHEFEYGFTEETRAELEKMGYDDGEIFLKIPDGVSDEARVYLFSCNFDWNHFHAEFVIHDGTRVHMIKQ